MAILLQVLLGLSLASAAGLRAFLPLLVLAVASRFGIAHVGGPFAWLHSDRSIAVLTVAAIAEILADKIPVLDHALDVMQTVIRPVAGALAVAGTQAHLDPTTAAVLGLILGAPLAAGFHLVKGATRVASTATTAGIANPFLSLTEDTSALALSLLALWMPILAFLLVLIAIFFGWRLWKHVRQQRQPSA